MFQIWKGYRIEYSSLHWNVSFLTVEISYDVSWLSQQVVTYIISAHLNTLLHSRLYHYCVRNSWYRYGTETTTETRQHANVEIPKGDFHFEYDIQLCGIIVIVDNWAPYCRFERGVNGGDCLRLMIVPRHSTFHNGTPISIKRCCSRFV